MRTIALLAGAACALATSSAVAQQKSERAAFLLAAGGAMAPMVASGLLYETRGHSDATVALAVAGICWGPSLGYGYVGSWGYALLSGLGKSALVGGAMWEERDAGPESHRYLSTYAAAGAALWSVADTFGLIFVVKRRNAETEGRPPRLVLAPYVVAGGGLSSAGVSGRF
jgi:hypothetical protein